MKEIIKTNQKKRKKNLQLLKKVATTELINVNNKSKIH